MRRARRAQFVLPAPRLSDLPSPKDIMGIEVYAGPATAPVWLADGPKGPLGPKRMCGVILLWTRDGSIPH